MYQNNFYDGDLYSLWLKRIDQNFLQQNINLKALVYNKDEISKKLKVTYEYPFEWSYFLEFLLTELQQCKLDQDIAIQSEILLIDNIGFINKEVLKQEFNKGKKIQSFNKIRLIKSQTIQDLVEILKKLNGQKHIQNKVIIINGLNYQVSNQKTFNSVQKKSSKVLNDYINYQQNDEELDVLQQLTLQVDFLLEKKIFVVEGCPIDIRHPVYHKDYNQHQFRILNKFHAIKREVFSITEIFLIGHSLQEIIKLFYENYKKEKQLLILTKQNSENKFNFLSVEKISNDSYEVFQLENNQNLKII